jgi:hypothetical protein
MCLSPNLLRKPTPPSNFSTRRLFLFALVAHIAFAPISISNNYDIEMPTLIIKSCCVISGVLLLHAGFYFPLCPLPVLLGFFSVAFAMEMMSHYATFGFILVLSVALFIYLTLLIALLHSFASLPITSSSSFWGDWGNVNLFGLHVGMLLALYIIPFLLPELSALYIPLSLYHSGLAAAYLISTVLIILGVRIGCELQKLHPKVLEHFGLNLLSTAELSVHIMVHNLSLYLLFFLFTSFSILEFSTTFHTPLFLSPLFLLQLHPSTLANSKNKIEAVIQAYGTPCALISLY